MDGIIQLLMVHIQSYNIEGVSLSRIEVSPQFMKILKETDKDVLAYCSTSMDIITILGVRIIEQDSLDVLETRSYQTYEVRAQRGLK